VEIDRDQVIAEQLRRELGRHDPPA
jgi:hypothetical protein